MGTKVTLKRAKRTAGEWRPAFLVALRNSGNVRAACQAAGISRPQAYGARERVPAFATAWDVALEDACDLLEAMARKRALEASDGLLMFLLRAHRPQVYRDTYRHELTDGAGGPLHLRVEVVGDRVSEPAALPAPANALVAVPLPSALREVSNGHD
jgi:hypothetical protein